jgi:hypothetical protein
VHRSLTSPARPGEGEGEVDWVVKGRCRERCRVSERAVLVSLREQASRPGASEPTSRDERERNSVLLMRAKLS